MRFLPEGWRRAFRVFRRAPEQEVDAELRFHFEERIAELIAVGTPPDPARAQAVAEFGDVEAVRASLVSIDERIADGRSRAERWEWAGQDLRYGLRSLGRSPGFVLTVTLTLALGLGANAAVFSMLDRLFLKPPPGVALPSTIRRVYRDVPARAGPAQSARAVAGPPTVPQFDYPEFRAMRAALPESAQVAGYIVGTAKLGRGGNALDVGTAYVDGDYFALLGVHPSLGRFFTSEELRPEVPVAEAIISDRLWKSRFGASPDSIGRVVQIDNHPHVIIGVAPHGFLGPDREPLDIWVPMNTSAGFKPTTPRWYEVIYSFQIIALVRAPTVESARVIVERAALAFHSGPLAEDSISTASLGPLVEAARPGSDASSVSIATRLAGVSLIILLIAIANVANLMLARGMRRRREIAVRLALGVTRGRLIGLLLCESLVLTSLGGLVAVAGAWWTSDFLRRLLLPTVRWADAPIDMRIVVFTGLLTLVTAIGAGLVPAFQASRPDVAGTLKGGVREGPFQRSRVRNALLIAQAALSVVLLSGAGLFVRSLHSVETEDIGYDVDRVVAASVTWDPDDGDHASDFMARFPDVLERVRHVPGVEHVGLTTSPPMGGAGITALFRANGDSVRHLSGSSVFTSWVSAEFFAAAGLRVVRGRGVLPGDRQGNPLVAIVNESMAHTVWPGEPAVGKCLVVTERGTPCREVVGVVADAHVGSIVEKPTAQLYLPTAQDTSRPARRLLIRAAPGRAARVAIAVRAAMRDGYGDWAVSRVRTMSEMLAPEILPWRTGAALFSAAGLLALLVAIVGIYSTISYVFSQRTHEIGVRMALGARAGNVARLVVGEGVRVVSIGVIFGLLLTLAAGRLVESMLYHTSPRDPVVLAVASLSLLLVAVGACIVPAWRALRVDPATALRAE